MKTAAILIAVLVVIVGAIVLRGAEFVAMIRPDVQRTASEALRSAPEGGRRRVTLFFVSRDDHAFREERREIEAGTTITDDAKRTLVELMKGPSGDDLSATVPRETKVQNLFIDSSGTAYVDFDQGIRNGLMGGAQEELYTVFSIVNTLASNFSQITRVQILIEGAETATLAGHVDTRTALLPQYVF